MNHYEFEIEIVKGNAGKLRKEGDKIIRPDDYEKQGICAWMYFGDGRKSYQVGQKFKYPEDMDKICPWLLDTLNILTRILRFGDLPWRYKNTPYEKVVDPDGTTTEYAQCFDPVSGIVVRITRNKVQ